MSESSQSSSGGIGIFGLLAVLFIGLKLTGYIDWSWWWVLAPIWLPLAIVFVLFVVVLASCYAVSFCRGRDVHLSREGSWLSYNFVVRRK